jgi:outer membrane protein OmpA-like peptidoglycan-associated protein
MLLFAAMALLCGCRTIRDRPVYYDPPKPVERAETSATSTTAVEPPRNSSEPIHSEPAVEEPLKIPRPLADVLEDVDGQLADAFFAYDRSDAGPDALATLQRDAALLKPVLAEFPNVKITVEGYCDERGSAEYNLALGDRRADRAAELLRQFGVRGNAIVPVSFGKEAPQCVESAEACWSRNRRAHLILRAPYISSQ